MCSQVLDNMIPIYPAKGELATLSLNGRYRTGCPTPTAYHTHRVTSWSTMAAAMHTTPNPAGSFNDASWALSKLKITFIIFQYESDLFHDFEHSTCLFNDLLITRLFFFYFYKMNTKHSSSKCPLHTSPCPWITRAAHVTVSADHQSS